MRDFDEASDEELIEAARSGDAGAFERLYRRHRDWVAGLAYRFSGHREDALDVLQETFLYLLRKLPTLELRCRLRTFLYPAVRHRALDQKEVRRRHQSSEQAPDPPAREDDPVEAGELAGEGFHHRLRRLPEGEREVVRLRFAGGLSLTEIAETLKIPLGTVKSRLHSALRALRRGPLEP